MSEGGGEGGGEGEGMDSLLFVSIPFLLFIYLRIWLSIYFLGNQGLDGWRLFPTLKRKRLFIYSLCNCSLVLSINVRDIGLFPKIRH